MSDRTRVGVEVGGTFTDLVAFEAGGVRITKVPSTPQAPHRGAIAALDESGLALEAADDLVHGSTVATNAVLERKGAKVAFFATEGFRDLLALQRQSRRSIYDIRYRKPEPVVPRRDTFDIPERTGPHGEVVTPLDEEAARHRVRQALQGGGYESVAICLLNSYANPAHERRVAEMIAERFPGTGITCSCDVTREFREYERASTTTLAAYVQPVIDRYLGAFERALGERGFAGRFSLMQSNGGRLPASGMAGNAITSLYSGPAAGVMGAIRQAGRSGYSNLITFDMGGTSTDVCLVQEGTPVLTSDAEIDGLPIRVPVLDIVTVGAGGGSIVWRDDGGMLRVGPRSAGAEPGPACYRRGGTDPTITDAHLVRGTVLADTFLGGRMEVDPALSRDAFGTLATHAGCSVEQVADDAIRVAEHNIVRAIQLVSTERGPRPARLRIGSLRRRGAAARRACRRGARHLQHRHPAGRRRALRLRPRRLGLRALREPHGALRPRRGGRGGARARAVRGHARGRGGRLRRARAHARARLHPHARDALRGQAFEVAVQLGAEEIARLDAAHLRERFNDAHHRIFEFDDSRTNRPEIVSFRLGIASPPPSVPALAGTDEAPHEAAGHALRRRRARKRPPAQPQRPAPGRHGRGAVAHRRRHVDRLRATGLARAGGLASQCHPDALSPGLRSPEPEGSARTEARAGPMALDQVDQAIISQALIAAAKEMGIKLVRSAYSPIVREANDCSAALLDVHGNVVSQAELIPMQLGPIGTTFRPCAELYPPETLEPGDFYINNHPYHGGQHVPDIFIFTPIFFGDRLVGFSSTVAHHLDLGGGAPGLNMAAGDVYQEGLIFPPSRYNVNRDWNGGPFERLVRANVRVPEKTIGDCNAQFAANGVGTRRVVELCEKFGADAVTQAMAGLLDYAEQRMRAAIAAAPDGVYHGEDQLDSDGVGDTPLVVRARVEIAGDTVSVDYEGTCDQVSTNVNCPSPRPSRPGSVA